MSQDRRIDFSEQRTIAWNDRNGSVSMIDQSLLPQEFRMIECDSVSELVNAIKELKIRGAPAIGVAGAMGVALSVISVEHANTKKELLSRISSDADSLREARPTAVNLSWGVERVLDFIRNKLPDDISNVDFPSKVIEYVKSLADEDVRVNIELSEKGAPMISSKGKEVSVLTHCNSCPDSGKSRVRVRLPLLDTEQLWEFLGVQGSMGASFEFMQLNQGPFCREQG